MIKEIQLEKDKESIRRMFNSIARHYDFLNHFLSFGIDKFWRKKLVSILKKELQQKTSFKILDIATGTGDLAIQAASLNPEKIIGIDISEEMLKIGQQKIVKKNLSNLIEFIVAEAENLPFQNNTFDATIVAFGVRNFYDLNKGLTEIYRVLKNDGILIILEFSQPSGFPIKQVYKFYFKNILPLIGRMFSKDKTAYQYLPDSVYQFPQGNNFLTLLHSAGFRHTSQNLLFLGISTIYSGRKTI